MYYSLTYSPFVNFEHWTFNRLEEVCSSLESKGVTVHTKVYELSDKRKLHVHMLVSARRSFYKRKLLVRGLSMQMDALKTEEDKLRWERYLVKSVHPENRGKLGVLYNNEQIGYDHCMFPIRRDRENL